MKMNPQPTTPAPLPVIATIRAAFQFVWDKREQMLRALAIPMAFLFVLEAVPYIIEMISEVPDKPEEDIHGLMWRLSILLSIPFYILFAITCHRLVLVGDQAVPAYGNLTWNQRETRFLGWCVVVSLAYLLIIITIPIGVSLLSMFVADSGTSPSEITDSIWQGFMYLLMLPSIYLISRLSLVYPATAVDRQVNLTWAWNLSHFNGWRLMVVVGLLPWVFSFREDLLLRENATLVESLLVVTIGLVLLAVEVVALSFSYKHLVEQVAPPAYGS